MYSMQLLTATQLLLHCYAVTVLQSSGGLLSAGTARSFLIGSGGRSRWFDKHTLCVLPSGAAAVNYEHSYSDGMCWCRNLGEVWHDMYNVRSK
jgi:Choline/Carnitine o-acyltransferase